LKAAGSQSNLLNVKMPGTPRPYIFNLPVFISNSAHVLRLPIDL